MKKKILPRKPKDSALIKLLKTDLAPSVPDIVGVYIIVVAIIIALLAYFIIM